MGETFWIGPRGIALVEFRPSNGSLAPLLSRQPACPRIEPTGPCLRPVFCHPCLAMRLGGVSGGRETQGWGESSHTPDRRRGEIRIGEAADGNGDVSRKAFAFPVDSGAACRTEMKGQRVAAFGCPHPRRSLAGEGDLLPAEARLVADHGAGAALALQAVAHGDARWFALN